MVRELLLGVGMAGACVANAQLPRAFDLRNVSGSNFVSSVKSQQGGTCWTHGTMAAIESNLMMTGIWANSGETGEPNLAEYHLDWWNGFNRNYNADIAPSKAGLTVHQGGDYRVAAAYLARGGGVVREEDGQSYDRAPKEMDPAYKVFYVRDVDWLVSNDDHTTDRIKNALMNVGAVGTALDWSDEYYSGNTFYQPPSSSEPPNHSVTIVGWDDDKSTDAPDKGAWLVKNSWGTNWGRGGYFWISYYDKTAGHHPEMGAVSFRNVEPMRYKQIYYHDYHGWRGTRTDVSEAFNAFVAKGNPNGIESVTALSFYTADFDVAYTAKIYGAFDNGDLKDELTSQEGYAGMPGHHTIDLDWPINLQAGQKFYVYLKLSKGGHPFDKTSDVPVLLGARSRVLVRSVAHPGESFYRKGNEWIDLTKDEASANFCMKALAQYW